MSLAHVTPYPLTWPIGWERTQWREPKNFKNSTFARGRDRLAKARIMHPDVPGGSNERMAALNAARDTALREAGAA